MITYKKKTGLLSDTREAGVTDQSINGEPRRCNKLDYWDVGSRESS